MTMFQYQRIVNFVETGAIGREEEFVFMCESRPIVN